MKPDMDVADGFNVEEGDNLGAADGLQRDEGMWTHQEVGSVLLIDDGNNIVACKIPQVYKNVDGADGI